MTDKTHTIRLTPQGSMNTLSQIEVDQLKRTGYFWATLSGTSVAVDDVVVPKAKTEIIDEAQAEVKKVRDQYANGIITDGERYNKIIDVWTHATSSVSRAVQRVLEEHLGR